MDRTFMSIEDGVITGVIEYSNWNGEEDPSFPPEDNMVEVDSSLGMQHIGFDYNDGVPTKGVFYYTQAAEIELEDRLGVLNSVASNALDWADLSDAKKAEWLAYRNVLKAIRSQAGWPQTVSWPTKPA
jgi:hypothetical protein